MLSGVSVDYYIKLERGTIGEVSASVLDAISRALQLTAAERDHLYLLTGTDPTLRTKVVRTSGSVRPAVQWMLDAITHMPAFVHTSTGILLAANALGRAAFSPLYHSRFTSPVAPSTPRFLFLDSNARDFFPEWDESAADTVANLRAKMAATPADAELRELIDDLNRESTEFRELWSAHDVRYHRTGFKEIIHPVVGALHLAYEEMPLPNDPGQNLVVYNAEPESATAQAFAILASWTATERSPRSAKPAE